MYLSSNEIVDLTPTYEYESTHIFFSELII